MEKVREEKLHIQKFWDNELGKVRGDNQESLIRKVGESERKRKDKKVPKGKLKKVRKWKNNKDKKVRESERAGKIRKLEKVNGQERQES